MAKEQSMIRLKAAQKEKKAQRKEILKQKKAEKKAESDELKSLKKTNKSLKEKLDAITNENNKLILTEEQDEKVLK